MSIIEKAVDKLERAGKKARDPESARTREGSSAPCELGNDAAGATSQSSADLGAGEALRDSSARTATKEDIGRSVNLHLDKLAQMGFVTPKTVEGLLAEQCRHIKRRVLMKASYRNGDSSPNSNVVMVTSALPGEGKTFVAINLAMSIAMERDRRVLLVDADFAKPDLCPVLGIEPGLGLMNVLSDPKLALADVLLATDVPKLTILSAGHPVPHMTELLASEAMRQLTEELSQRYPDRIIIFDSMPLLAKAGTSVLAGLAGQILLVVEAIRTPHGAVQDALKLLDHPERAGLVLNKSRERSDYGSRYGYYYHG
jgi:protein-tyrosine kinase